MEDGEKTLEKRIKVTSDEPDVEGHRKLKATDDPGTAGDSAREDDEPDVEAHRKLK